MSEPEIPQEPNPVSESWQQWCRPCWQWYCWPARWLCSTTTRPSPTQGAQPDELHKQVPQLTQQVEQLERQQAMPALVLNRYRNSIGYIYGVYQVGFPHQSPTIRARVSGTGFLVGNGLLATNRHVAEPWYGDTEAEGLIDRGATAMLESLVVFFPGSPTAAEFDAGHGFFHGRSGCVAHRK